MENTNLLLRLDVAVHGHEYDGDVLVSDVNEDEGRDVE